MLEFTIFVQTTSFTFRQFAPFLRHNEYKIVFTITTPRRLNVFPIENYIRRIR